MSQYLEICTVADLEKLAILISNAGKEIHGGDHEDETPPNLVLMEWYNQITNQLAILTNT